MSHTRFLGKPFLQMLPLQFQKLCDLILNQFMQKKMFAQLLNKISSWLPLSLWVSFYDKSDNNARPNLFSLCHVIKNIYTKQNYLKFNLKLTSKLSSHNFLSLDHIQMINYWDLRDCYSIHIANKGRLGFAFLVHQSVQVRARHHSGKGGCQI